MPREKPLISWYNIRLFCEKFAWIDPASGLPTEGYNPPEDVPKERVPFTVKYITGSGNVESGRAVCLKVNARKHLRMIKFVDSGEIRWIRDYLIMEINDTEFVTRTIDF